MSLSVWEVNPGSRGGNKCTHTWELPREIDDKPLKLRPSSCWVTRQSPPRPELSASQAQQGQPLQKSGLGLPEYELSLKVIKFSLCLPRTRSQNACTSWPGSSLLDSSFNCLLAYWPAVCLPRFLFESQTTEDHVGTALGASYQLFSGWATEDPSQAEARALGLS